MASIKVYLADEAGLCFGVRKAIDTAKVLAESADESDKIYTLGPLVHNQSVINSLEASGVTSIGFQTAINASRQDNTTAIIRAHGEKSDVKKTLAESCNKLIDATCPMVLAIKKKIDKAVTAGSLAIIYGKPAHAEAIGLKDDREGVIVVNSPEDLTSTKNIIIAAESVALFAQSTMSPESFQQIAQELKTIRQDAIINNTICQATIKRRKALRELAAKVDLVIIAGDKSSSNASNLLKLAKEQTQAYLVSSHLDLKSEWFEGVTEVGVSAGASTPDDVIEGVVRAIEEMSF